MQTQTPTDTSAWDTARVNITAYSPETPVPLGGRLYGAEYSDGTVKVGRSRNVAQRLHSHANRGAPFGLTIDRVWISEPVEMLADAEHRMIRWVASESAGGARRRHEYFTDVTLERTAEIATAVLDGEDAGPGPEDPPRPFFVTQTDLLTCARVAAAVRATGLSVREVSARANLSYASVYRKMRGARAFGLEEIARIARITGVEPMSLIEFEEVQS